MADQKIYPSEKVSPSDHIEETVHEAAERGRAATDQYGRALVSIDPVAERKLLWKIDLCVVPTVSLLYLFCFIDRANIGNANIAGFQKDLGLAGNDYNAVLSVFYVSYILFEIPATMLCKRLGPGRFIPTTTLLFGICSLGTAFVHNFSQACGVRFLLGIFEAGMLPGIAYYLSRWYRRSELAFRLALYIVMAPLAGAFGGLLASGILKLSNIGSLTTWRMIFFVEGVITCGLALIAYFTLTDHPARAKWLSQEERDLAIARVKSERVGNTEVVDRMDVAKLKRGIFNPVVLSTALIFCLNNVTVQGLAFFLPKIVATIYPTQTVIYQQLMSAWPNLVGAFFTLMFPLLSWYLDRRQVIMIMSAPLVSIGYILFLASTSGNVRYGATFIITAGAFSFGALCNAQAAANVVSDTSKAAAISTVTMAGNIGGLVSTWAFLAWDAPNYHIGNGLNLATSMTMFLTATVTLLWMNSSNRKRDAKDVDAELAGKDSATIADLEWKHPSFRWRP